MRGLFLTVGVVALSLFTFDVARSICDDVACDGIDFCCQVREVNGVNVISTPKSYAAEPQALDLAEMTIAFITSRLDPAYLGPLDGHIVYVYHCDPTISTGVFADPKQDIYDYPSDIYGYETNPIAFGGDNRTYDAVYGYGGGYIASLDVYFPTSVCDINLYQWWVRPQNIYWNEDILIHEFGHTLQDLAVLETDQALYDYIENDVYNEYLTNVPEAAGSYCGRDPYEMFACAIQTWFFGSARTGSALEAPGIMEASAMQTNVPSLYAVLEDLFGDAVTTFLLTITSAQGINDFPDWQYYNHYVWQFGYLDSVNLPDMYQSWLNWNWYGNLNRPTASPTPPPTGTYVGVAMEKSYEDAKDYCEGMGSYLASISSEVDNEDVRAAATNAGVPPDATLWIGLDRIDSSSLEWSDGSMNSYSNMYQFNNVDKSGVRPVKQCVAMNYDKGDQWVPKQCDSEFYFVCN